MCLCMGKTTVALVAVVVALVTAVPRPAFSQATAPGFTAPPPSSTSPDRPATAPREENPGLINEIGKLWDKSTSMLPSLIPSADKPAAGPMETAVPRPGAAPDRVVAPPPAVEAPPAVPNPSLALVPSMVSGKIQCPTAGNGAPDCKAGADQLCQSKGYRDGKSLSSDSVEVCSAKRLIPGRERKPDDCHTNYFVTRAICQ
jgi:hypothetical protein